MRKMENHFSSRKSKKLFSKQIPPKDFEVGKEIKERKHKKMFPLNENNMKFKLLLGEKW